MKSIKSYLLYKCSILIMVLTLSGCATVPITPYYFNNQRLNDLKRVGIIIRVDSIRVFMTDDVGSYEPARYGRYEEPLNFVDNKINPTSEIKIFYEELLKEKGISIKELDYKLRYGKRIKYNKQPPPYPKKINEPIFPFDLKNLVNHFAKDDEIDAILIVRVQYGLNVNKMFTLFRNVMGTGIIDKVGDTRCIISSLIVDLNDKNIVYEGGSSRGRQSIKGKWNTPPEYENLTNSFKSAISDALEEERAKLNWQPKI